MEEKKVTAKNLDMTQGSPVKLLIRFAIPMLIGGIFQLMYNMVDTVVVGRFVSTEALAAIGACGTTSMFIMSMGSGVTNAVSVIIAQAEGSRQGDLIKKAVAHAIYLTIAAGALLGVLSFFGARPLLTLLGTPANIIDDSVAYIRITGGLTMASIASMSATSILRSIGDSRTPLYFLIFSSFLNIGLDLLFVLALHGGVAGVAYATVICQLISAVLCIVYIVKKYPRLCPDKESWQYDGGMIGDYLRIGLPICVQSAVLNVGMFVITAVINSFGSDIVAAYTIGSKVEQMATILFSNFAFSFSVYAGQNFGAGKYDRIREGTKQGSLIIVGLSVVSTLIIMLFANPLARLFMDTATANAELVLKAAVSMVCIDASLFSVLGLIWAANSALRGVGAVKVTLVSSIVELVSKIAFSLLLPRFLGYVGIWMAAPIGWVLGLIVSMGYLIHWFTKPDEEKAMTGKKRRKAQA